MQYNPNKTIVEYLRTVLPLFTDKFTNKLSVQRCGIITGTDDYYVDVIDNSIIDKVGDQVNINQLLFKYNYTSYEVITKHNMVYILVKLNTLDRQIAVNNCLYIEDLSRKIPLGYYTITDVLRGPNETHLYVKIGDDHAEEMFYEDLLTQPVLTFYTDYGNLLYGYNGVKTIKSIADEIDGVTTYKRITLEKDKNFNFNVLDSDFECKFASVHFELANIIHSEIEEFENTNTHSGIKYYSENQKNALIVYIGQSRSAEDAFNVSYQSEKFKFVPMVHFIRIQTYLYDSRRSPDANADNEADADVYNTSYITDILSDTSLKIIHCCILYNRIMRRGATKSTDINAQIRDIASPRYTPVDGYPHGNMKSCVIQMEMTSDVFGINPTILNSTTMIKGIEAEVAFTVYQNL